jgi:hypothetical protein
VVALIQDCRAHDPNERPIFGDIPARMNHMDFQVMRCAQSWKVPRFANAVIAQERMLGIDIEDSVWMKTNHPKHNHFLL